MKTKTAAQIHHEAALREYERIHEIWMNTESMFHREAHAKAQADLDTARRAYNEAELAARSEWEAMRDAWATASAAASSIQRHVLGLQYQNI